MPSRSPDGCANAHFLYLLLTVSAMPLVFRVPTLPQSLSRELVNPSTADDVIFADAYTSTLAAPSWY